MGHEDAGPSQVKDPLSALAAAAELDQVRNDVAAVNCVCVEAFHDNTITFSVIIVKLNPFSWLIIKIMIYLLLCINCAHSKTQF